jgi:hypothetical protein
MLKTTIFLSLCMWLVCGCTQIPSPKSSHYPSHWWAAVETNGAPAWEIFPQDAKPGEVILSKRNELGLLSNFAAAPFTYKGKRYASIEGFWQMMKFPEDPGDVRATFPGIRWLYSREQVGQMTGFTAKRAGDVGSSNMVAMGIDWVTFEGQRMPYRSQQKGLHYRLIVEATREKVRQNEEVRRVLLSTGNLVLRPDHRQEPNAPPEWRYYEILMGIRKEIR